MRIVVNVWARAGVAGISLSILMVTATAAEAQQMIVPQAPPFDRVRVAAFLWRGKSSGTIDFEQLSRFPGFEDGINVTDTLGLTEAQTGWILEGNIAAGRRHRFLIGLSRLENSGQQEIPIREIGPEEQIDLIVRADSRLTLRGFYAYYNGLLVANPRVEAGLLAGVGRFDVEAAVSANVGRVRARLDQAYPAFGGNLLVNPEGPVRGYVELAGFPRVTVDDLSGWLLDLTARAEVFVIRNVGLTVGYRRYRLVFENADRLALDFMWDGFTFGAEARF